MSWELESWQPVETLEASEPQVIDVHWQPVESLEPCDEVLDVQAVWLEPEPASYPVKQASSDLERHVNEYIVTDADMNTARDWLARVDTMQQLAPAGKTNTQPLTALWQHLAKPVQQTRTGPQRVTSTAASEHGPRWYFVAERDPSEPESLQHLRYWFMQYQYGEGVTEWSEAAFIEWAQSLTDDELAIFADAGEQIALGNWQDQVNDATADVIEQTRASEEASSDPVEYVVNAFKGLF